MTELKITELRDGFAAGVGVGEVIEGDRHRRPVTGVDISIGDRTCHLIGCRKVGSQADGDLGAGCQGIRRLRHVKKTEVVDDRRRGGLEGRLY